MENRPLSPTIQPQQREEEGEGQEPIPKKQKMSTTTSATSDDDEFDAPVEADAGVDSVQEGPKPERKPRYKRRKIAIFFAYCGVGYQGMQKNPGAKTIEGDLEEALFHAGGVPEHDRGCPRRYDWARSARTDKGVSAVGQVVSGRFYVDPPGFIDRLNSILPPQIRIFGYKRATKSFNAKKFCDRRRYVYLIPLFALDPSCHRDRESVLASMGSGNELVKCLECSERGRKVIGIMGKRNFDSEGGSRGSAVQSGVSSNSGAAESSLEMKEEGQVTADSLANTDQINDNCNENKETGKESESATNETARSEGENENGEVKVVKNEFCYGDEERERFNRILRTYEGTHNFHNFTTRTKAEDPAAKRYIISFDAKTTVHVDGIEFVKCEVVGQSFMLHQIRKMIGLAVAIMRNAASESLIETAFRPDININVPMAPEVGLYLDECFFSSYNKRWGDGHEKLSMEAYVGEAESFKMKYIYSHIASTEHKEGAVALWLHSLNHRNYPDLSIGTNSSNTDPENLEADATLGSASKSEPEAPSGSKSDAEMLEPQRA